YLRAVLEAAQDAGRTVILTADHGHVLERDLERLKRTGENARWRLDLGGELEAGEVSMHGPRVLSADGKAVLMSSVTRRYAGMNQNGYHGGASPQEVVVPLAILAPRSSVPKGWIEVGFMPPAFWLIDSMPVPVRHQAEAPKKVVKPQVPKDHLPFEPVEQSATLHPGNTWVERLVASELYREQEKRWRRMAPKSDRVSDALAALSSKGGKMTSPALAHALNMPLPKLPGFGSAMQKLLNLDGVFVVTFDASSDSWILDEGMALRQFLE
ncbi:MAG TPA: BREX-2 system phosphatase PglZ, partial [Planctomycetota bacterium]|nr:BREX-2 system phosphatase PglZ [Planctomycetota bacterium]